MTQRPNLLAAEDLPAEPRQKRSLDKRERLKAAGLAVFGEKGYEGASIEEIARRADLAVGGFYRHFRSKRQLLLALMDELLDKLSRLELRPKASASDVQSGIEQLLAGAFSADLRYLGAYRAWQEAALADPVLAAAQQQIHAWTTARIRKVFELLHRHPNARRDVDIPNLARVMDSFFWNLLAQAGRMRKAELNRWIHSSAHLIYHAIIKD